MWRVIIQSLVVGTLIYICYRIYILIRHNEVHDNLLALYNKKLSEHQKDILTIIIDCINITALMGLILLELIGYDNNFYRILTVSIIIIGIFLKFKIWKRCENK